MLVVYSVFPDLETAQNISKEAVSNKLAACANIFPQIQSFYIWKEQVENSFETVVLFKTSPAKSEALQKWILQHHPYEIPCLMTFRPQDINDTYLNWLQDTLRLRP